MRFVVEYVGDGGYTFGKKFKDQAAAKAFAESLGKNSLDYYSETIVDTNDIFEVVRRIENLRYTLN